ncbi:MAG: NAD(P)-dependent oxidoreductase [Actinobacteria bacterium]|nr:NAD(P)-dependent oxidoreductase [Actinomycetota bacterium]
MKIGFVGLGNMGMPMAKNLRKAGHTLVVHNRTRAKAELFAKAGGTVANSPGEVAKQVEALLVNLPFPQTCEDVLIGAPGALGSAPDGQLWIDFSTNGPDTAQRIAAAAARRGIGYVDAPVSGGPTGAEAGTLAIMAGGAKEDFDRAKPLLDVLGGNVQHFGPVGAGCVAKLANQMVVAATNAILAEAYVLAVRNGIDPQQLFGMLKTAMANSRSHELVLPNVVLPRKFDARFAVDLLSKDIGLAVALGRRSGVRLLMTNLADQLFQEAQAKGYGKSDIGAIFRPLEELAGVEVKGDNPV